VVTHEEITLRRRAEDDARRLQGELAHAQKMESVGRLAGGVAHDFNNMLSVILGHVWMALEHTPAGSELATSLGEIRQAAERSTALTRQLLALARRQQTAPRVVDLNETIAGTLTMLRRLIGEQIEIEWRPAPGLGALRIDPSQIDQILTNTTINARDAIDGVGRIVIATSDTWVTAEANSASMALVPGRYATLTVSDTGSGMDAETLGHLFEPFFTTKALGKGTGLGLATVYGIVRQNNGFVDVESTPGSGTTLRISLPVHEGPLTEPGAAERDPVRGGTETILLVEDEPSLLRLTGAMLERLGYRVLAAATPHDAVAVADGGDTDIALLLTDVIMPEMNGKDLSSRLRGDFPGMRTLFMSGYTANIITSQGIADEGLHFISKPFTARELGVKIRQILDA
jgi:two-component system, cell cycle sensor histidine kinase and response regulator CckA